VVSSHQEAASPKVRAPVAYGVDEADQFPLVHRQGTVARRNRPTEERHGVLVLQEDGAKALGGGVALDDEGCAKSGRRSTGPVVTASLRASKAAAASSDQENPSLRKRAVRGAAIVP